MPAVIIENRRRKRRNDRRILRQVANLLKNRTSTIQYRRYITALEPIVRKEKIMKDLHVRVSRVSGTVDQPKVGFSLLLQVVYYIIKVFGVKI